MKLSQWPWALWWAQIRAVLRLEMKKGFFARRALWIYLLAFAPVLLFAARSMRAQDDIGESTHTFAAVFQFFFLRLSVFFGCVGIFINLIRGDVLEKSLHYYFLAPVRREVLLAGKYLSGMLAAVVIFGTSAVLQFAALYWHFGWDQVQEYLLGGHGLTHIAAYLGVTVLACIGYGSVFLAAGVLFRNPLVPAFIVLVWEAVNGFLPGVLQKISVIYYLKSLCPVEVPAHALDQGGPLALIAFNADPASPVVAILGLLVVSLSLLVVAGLQLRQMEINYGAE